MDDAVNARLLKARFVKLCAEIGPGAKFDKSGNLKSSISAGLGSDDKANQAFAQVAIEVMGIPTDKTEKDYAFKIEAICQGLYEWSTPSTRPEDLGNLTLTQQLCRPIHALVVAEIGNIAQRLGFGSVNIPWALEVEGKRKSVARRAPGKIPSGKTASVKQLRKVPRTANK